jgi:hypothetical protein
MAILRDITFPLANYPTGEHNLPQRSVPDSATELYFEFARCTDATPTIWPNAATRLQMDFEGSTDGVNWTPAGGFGAVGGIITRIGGAQIALTTVRVPLPAMTGRLLRATVTITNGPLRTQGAMELRD